MRSCVPLKQPKPVNELDVMFSSIRAANSWSEVVATLLAHGAELNKVEGENFALVFRGKRIIRLSPVAGTLPDLTKRLGNMPSTLVGP
ncbi:hypothetical protein [Aquipseudomonas alcaligenes]|uniref:Ankyrin repeat domain-containing protein n=1 Tax=Aquipseudomonas alcaligenes TaxID=43263 RepID=A0A1N6XD47_AQUAC|nr:hypothetical protein [Pseudomonas alcaligenes]SIR00169.1 hypothetical protein SAMN05878282_11287 [Pseudomonas alcaligenes]